MKNFSALWAAAVVLLAPGGVRVAVAQEPICYLPIDVMFLQDTTGSFVDDLPNVVRQIPDMVQAILAQNPDSHFGVAEFKDKPYYFVGENDDFCYKLNGALTPSIESFQHDYSTLYASGGGDLPESQFQALIDITEDPQVGWRPIERPARSGTQTSGARLVIMSTDAAPHIPSDIINYQYDFPEDPIGSHPFSPNPGVGSGISHDTLCRDYNYPSDIQVKDALTAANVYLAILTPKDSPDVTAAWKYVNEQLLGQPPAFYQFIENDSSNLLTGVLAAIRAVSEVACAAPPITTPVPIETTPPPTPAPTQPPPPPPTTPPPPPPTTAPPPPPPPPTTAPPPPPTTPPPPPPTTAPPPPPPTTAPPPPPTTAPPPPPTTAPPPPPTTAPPPPPTTAPPPPPATTTLAPPPMPTGSDCVNPCPPLPAPCCHRAAVVVKVNDRPKMLKVDYIK